jgi:transcriptional regulator with GAF, ATPase, and Fis domain
MPARITVCYPDRPVVEAQLFENAAYRIGRAQNCELTLNHPTVSRHHAHMSFDPKGWRIDDQRSQNGTRVNGIKVTRRVLNGDELISVGELDCVFETQSHQQQSAMESHNAWRQQQLQQLSKVSTHDLQTTLDDQLTTLLSLVGLERGLILFGQSIAELKIAACQGMRQQDFCRTHFEGSVGAIEQATLSLQSVIAMDTSRDRLLSHRKSISLKQIAALACIPMTIENKLIGVVYADSKCSNKFLTELDLEILQGICHQIELLNQAIEINELLTDLKANIAGNQQQLYNRSLIQLIH